MAVERLFGRLEIGRRLQSSPGLCRNRGAVGSGVSSDGVVTGTGDRQGQFHTRIGAVERRAAFPFRGWGVGHGKSVTPPLRKSQIVNGGNLQIACSTTGRTSRFQVVQGIGGKLGRIVKRDAAQDGGCTFNSVLHATPDDVVFLRQRGFLVRRLLDFCAIQPRDVAETFLAWASRSFGAQTPEALKIRGYALMRLSRLRRGRLENDVKLFAGKFLSELNLKSANQHGREPRILIRAWKAAH